MLGCLFLNSCSLVIYKYNIFVFCEINNSEIFIFALMVSYLDIWIYTSSFYALSRIYFDNGEKGRRVLYLWRGNCMQWWAITRRFYILIELILLYAIRIDTYQKVNWCYPSIHTRFYNMQILRYGHSEP